MKARKLSILFVVLATVYLTVGMVLANETTVFEPLSHESTLAAPTLTGTTAGTTVSLSWTSVVGATGYILYYAPYPYTGSDSIGNISMGTQTSMSASLWDGAAFYVAVKAYDSKHFSGYSNIELFRGLSGFLNGKQRYFATTERGKGSCARMGSPDSSSEHRSPPPAGLLALA